MKNNSSYVIGVDFGTDSVRSMVVDAANGNELAASVCYYPRWKQGLYCNPSINQFRQHPLDYLESLEISIKGCVAEVGNGVAENIKGISVDTTGSTPVAVDGNGVPLALRDGFTENPNAMFVLWKDHTSIKEAAEINDHAASFSINYLQYVGGVYSSEWFWAKLLHVLREDEGVRKNMASWVEHCDWIPFVLTGGNDVAQLKRGVCSAGHKALWAKEFGGLPPSEFFTSLDPLLSGITSKLFTETYNASQPVATLSQEWADRLGLSNKVVVGIGGFDCHFGAVGGEIEPYFLSKVIGTSTCDILVAPIKDVEGKLIKGICGQVPGSVIPGMLGLEAGQSAFGDVFAWFKNLLAWPLRFIEDVSTVEKATAKILPALDKACLDLPNEDYSELALDWLNGRRTPDTNQMLKGALTGLSLASDAVMVYRALAEATCFGAKSIVDRFIEEGIPIKGMIGLGGVAKKSPFIMQMMADVCNMPIRVHRSEQTCALGAAMFAATAAGLYEKVEDAMKAMGQGFDKEYLPNPEKTTLFAKRYEKYQRLGTFIESELTISA